MWIWRHWVTRDGGYRKEIDGQLPSFLYLFFISGSGSTNTKQHILPFKANTKESFPPDILRGLIEVTASVQTSLLSAGHHFTVTRTKMSLTVFTLPS